MRSEKRPSRRCKKLHEPPERWFLVLVPWIICLLYPCFYLQSVGVISLYIAEAFRSLSRRACSVFVYEAQCREDGC